MVYHPSEVVVLSTSMNQFIRRPRLSPLSNQRNCASSLRAPLRALATPPKSNVAHSWLLRVLR